MRAIVVALGRGEGWPPRPTEGSAPRTATGPSRRSGAGWARRAIERWIAWDEAGRDRLLPRLFFQTGDLILREAANRYFTETRRYWDALGTPTTYWGLTR